MQAEPTRIRVNGHAHAAPSEEHSAPHDINIEQALLGAILTDNKCLDLFDRVRPEHFYYDVHARVFEVALERKSAGLLVNPLTLRRTFEGHQASHDVSVPQYLGSLMTHAAGPWQIPDYIHILLDHARDRELDAIKGCAERDPQVLIDHLKALRERFTRTNEDNLEFASDVSLERLTPYVIKGVFAPKSTVLIYGPSGAGKTFLAIYLAASIARGEDVFGRRVQQGATLYIPLEGKPGFGGRILSECKARGDVGHRLAWYKLSVALGTDPAVPAQLEQIIAAANALANRAGCPVSVIVIDTLACALSTDNENDAATIAAVMAQTDQIKAATGAAVVLLHHPGKDGNKGLRGSSALHAAADVVIRIERESGAAERQVVIEKAKDGVEGPLGVFTLNDVALGVDADGDPITSCVVVPSATAVPRPRGPKPGTAAHNALLELSEIVINGKGAVARKHERAPDGAVLVRKDEWRDACLRRQLASGEPDSEKRTFNRAVQDLSKSGIIGSFGSVVWMCRDTAGTKGTITEHCPGTEMGV